MADTFAQAMHLMRKHDPQLREDGFAMLEPIAAEVLPQLIAAFEEEPAHGLRCWLLELIGDARSESALPVLIKELVSDDESIRVWARRGLEQLNTKEARAALWRGLHHETRSSHSLPQSAANRTRPNERQHAREDMAKLAPAPSADKPPSPLHRVPQGLRRPNQVLRSRYFNIKYGAHRRDDLAAGVGWQVSKRVPVHGHTLCPSCRACPHLPPRAVFWRRYRPSMGYHGYEYGLTLGNLLHDVAGEEAAWQSRH